MIDPAFHYVRRVLLGVLAFQIAQVAATVVYLVTR